MTPCKTKIHIRFADIDSMGHVNNAIYLSYFEQARMDFFKKKFNDEWDWNTDGIILVKNEIEYLAPVLLNDEIFILTQVSHVGNKSFTFTYVVHKIIQAKTIICCTGSSVLVAFDHQTKSSKVIPEKWKTLLQENLI